MFKYRLKSIRLQNGAEFEPGKLTVVVGPNNSGKSRLLRDIKDLCTTQNPYPVVVEAAEHTRPANAADLLDAYRIRPQLDKANGRISVTTLSADMNSTSQQDMYAGGGPDWEDFFQNTIQNYLDNWNIQGATQFAAYFGSYFIARLTTESRLLLTKESQSGNPEGPIANLLQAFYYEGRAAEEKLSDLVQKAFPPLRIRLDYSGLSTLRFRVGDSFERIPDDPRDARP